MQWESTNGKTTNSSNLSRQNPSIISQHSEIMKEESLEPVESENALAVNEDEEDEVQGTQNLATKTQNDSNLTKKLNKSKKDKNSSRSKRGLIIEITKPSQKTQDKTNVEPEISRTSKQSSLLDLSKEDSQNMESLKFSLNNLTFSQKSVYENIDKETEIALEEVLLNIEEFDEESNENEKEFSKSPNLFDSECSANNCSALEQNVLGSLHLSDFEMTNLSRKRSSGWTEANLSNNQAQEVSKNAEIIENRKTGTIEDMFTTADFDVNFTVNKESEVPEVKEIDANIENDLRQNEADPNEVNLNEENVGLSGIRLSDFEFTAPLKPDSGVQNSTPKENVSEIRASVFDFSSSMNVPQPKEIPEREVKETAKRNESQEGNKNYLSGINVSDFEMTNKNDKSKEILSGINASEFELSKVPKISKKSKNNSKGYSKSLSKGNSVKENSQMGTSDYLLANISENLPPIKLNVNTNDLEITKTKVSRDVKLKSESISGWNEDSWDNVHIKEITGTSDGGKRIKNIESNSGNKENLIKNRKLIEKRKYSGAEGSPIASVETYKARRVSVASNQSDSDDMFAPPKKMKVSHQTSKPGSSKIQSDNSKRVSNEKSVRSSLDHQCSFESLVFSEGETSVHSVKKVKDLPLEISSDVKQKNQSDQKWKSANVIISKKMFTLLKQKLLKRTEISFALDCEPFTEKKITIGAKILGGHNDEDKKSKSVKFVCGDKKICGASISWGYNALYYIPLINFPGLF